MGFWANANFAAPLMKGEIDMKKIFITYYSIGSIISAIKYGIQLSTDKMPKGTLPEELYYYLIHNQLTWPKYLYDVLKSLKSE